MKLKQDPNDTSPKVRSIEVNLMEEEEEEEEFNGINKTLKNGFYYTIRRKFSMKRKQPLLETSKIQNLLQNEYNHLKV